MKYPLLKILVGACEKNKLLLSLPSFKCQEARSWSKFMTQKYVGYVYA